MKTLIYLFFKFMLIRHCVCYENYANDEPSCDPEPSFNYIREPLILINNGKNKDQNHLFQDQIKNLVPNIMVIREMCPGGVNGIIKALHLYPNSDIVHLDVNDFYQFNYNFVINNSLNYAGEIGDSITTFSSHVIDMTKVDLDSKEIKDQTLRHVKLYSSRGKVDQIVYDYIHEFEDESTTNKRYIVLICLNEQLGNQITKLIESSRLYFNISSNCKDDIEVFKHEIFAVLANEPIEMDDELPFPIVLYSTHHSHMSASSYKNVLTLTSTNPNEVFKKALIRFMEKAQWQRIAILCDNYDHSLEFERSLLSLFDEKNVMYAVFRIEENINGNYNFFEVLNRMKDADARVVFLNMEEKNVKKLSELMRYNRKHNFEWILRDQLGDAVTRDIGNVVSINLTPAITNWNMSNRVDSLRETAINTIKIKSILEGVQRLQYAYNEIGYNDRNGFFYIYRQIGQVLRKTSLKETQVYVTYQDKYKDSVLLGSMLFYDVTLRKENYTSQHIPLDMADCEIRSNNYFRPCNYFEIIYLMFVIIVFIATFFTILIFFSDKNIIHGRRNYRNL